MKGIKVAASIAILVLIMLMSTVHAFSPNSRLVFNANLVLGAGR